MVLNDDIEKIRLFKQELDASQSVTEKPVAQPKNTSVQLTDALLCLPDIMEQLKNLAVENRRENDVTQIVTQLDYDLKLVASQTHDNLTLLKELEQKLTSRLNYLDLFEAKIDNMVTRVTRVLDVLENELKI